MKQCLIALSLCCLGLIGGADDDVADKVVKKFKSARSPRSLEKAIKGVEEALASADGELKSSIISGMRDAVKEKLEKILSRLPKRPSSRLTAERKALNALAADALKEIARKEYDKGNPQKHEIQKKIDGIVAEMKMLWKTGDRKVLSKACFDQQLMSIMCRGYCEKWAVELVTEFDDFILKFTQGTATSVRDFPLDLDEAKMIFHSRIVDDYNERLYAKFGGKTPQFSRQVFDHLKILNDYRNMMGLPSLILNLRLTNAAYMHSIEMSKAHRIWHNGPDGTPAERAKKARFQGSCTGENVCRGADSPLEAFMLWYNSPPHHKNMVNKGHQNIGVGFAADSWTQHFGARAGLIELN